MGVTHYSYLLIGLQIPTNDIYNEKVTKKYNVCHCQNNNKEANYCCNCGRKNTFDCEIEYIPIIDISQGIKINGREWEVHEGDGEDGEYVYILCADEISLSTYDLYKTLDVKFSDLAKAKEVFRSDMRELGIWDKGSFGIHLVMEEH